MNLDPLYFLFFFLKPDPFLLKKKAVGGDPSSTRHNYIPEHSVLTPHYKSELDALTSFSLLFFFEIFLG